MWTRVVGLRSKKENSIHIKNGRGHIKNGRGSQLELDGRGRGGAGQKGDERKLGDEECGGKGFPRGSGGITTMVFGDPTSSTFLISSQPPKPQEPGAVEKTLSSPLSLAHSCAIFLFHLVGQLTNDNHDHHGHHDHDLHPPNHHGQGGERLPGRHRDDVSENLDRRSQPGHLS